MSLRKAGKAVQKLLSGQFSELADRGREVLQVRRERQHYERGDLHFTTERFAEIFRKEYRHKHAGAHDDLDLVIALREHECFAFIPGFAQRQEFPASLKSVRPDEAERILRTADALLADHFPVFSLGSLDYGTPPRWNYDPLHEQSAPESFYADIEYLNAQVSGDAKVIWEPARFQFVYDLGQAYLLSGDEKYARKFFELIKHWSESHPDYGGIGFSSALEFAFRIHSLCWGIGFFGASPALDQHAAACIYRIIWLGAHFISNHLSLWFSPNTHLLGEAYALYLVGSRFPEFEESTRWRELGHAILSEELDRQFTLDGMHAELSTAYHAYALEFYLSAYLIASVSGDPLKERITARLPGMLEVLGALQRPDGTWPHIGDEDGGRLFFLSRAASGDFRPLLEAATLIEKGDRGSGYYLESFWLAGADLCDTYELSIHSQESHNLFSTGLFIARDPKLKSQAILQHGPFGYLDSPHSHADMLHLELAVGTDNFIVDPGTYVYTADLDARNRFRSSAYHNGPLIAGTTLMRAGDPFGWQQKPDAHCLRQAIGKLFSYCEAGYKLSQAQGEAGIRRGLLSLGDGCWLLWDRISAQSPLEISWSFISPLKMIRDGDTIQIVGTEGELLIMPLASADSSLQISIGEAEISADYLARQQGSALKLRVAASAKATLFMLLQWVPIKSRNADFVKLAEASCRSCRWQTQLGTHHLLIGSDGEKSQKYRSDAKAAYVREVNNEPVRMILLEGSELGDSSGKVIEAQEKLHYLDAVRTDTGWLTDHNPVGVKIKFTDQVKAG